MEFKERGVKWIGKGGNRRQERGRLDGWIGVVARGKWIA